uniref:protein-tyrosine-phosphatase n=1 Tax=Astyanax mexicanus TaxID=7994 RepID=A0A8B9M108_ASTMX
IKPTWAPPRFTKIPTDQIGVSGGVVSFVCQATGDPKPQVNWNKKGKKVNSQRIEFAAANLKKKNIKCQLKLKEKKYDCILNSLVEGITVQKDLLTFGFPSIDMGPQLKVVERTRTATMLCAASGIPDPEISWFKDFLPVEPALSQGRIKQLRSGALQIERSEETDQGKYECVASNSKGVRYSSPANLYVRVRRVPPRFTILPSSHEIMPGGSVNITCVAVGSPMPYVKWMLNSEDLTPEDEMPVGRNVLELNGVRESANYTCVAMSSLGIIEAVAQVIVKSLPRAPGTPIVTETTATSVTITWDSGNPDPVSYYIIQYRAKSPDSKFETVDGITTTRYSIGGLYPNTEYEIRVSAFNTIGQGPPSNKVEARTGEQAPASPPRNIQAQIISQNTVIVRWEEPEEPNGQIKGYRVYYTMDPSQPMSNWQIHNVQDSVITTIQSLVPSETYTIRVLAFTSVGDGPFSDPVHVKVMPGVPGQPGKFRTGKVRDTAVELLWDPPFSKEPIKSYELIYKAAEYGTQEKKSFEPRSSYMVEGLRANTEYTFSLAAISTKGMGAFTNEIAQRTAQAKPSAAPGEVRCSSPSSSSLLVSWRPPPEESQNGELTGYELRYQDVGDDKNGTEALPEKTIRTKTGVGQVLLKSLAKWRRYRVSVSAVTAQGSGPESASLECRTDEDVPGAPPSQVEVQPLNSTAIKVSWQSVLPGQRNGQVRGYQVHYARLENGESQGLPRIRDIMLDDAQDAIIGGLQPETTYSVTVAAYTIKGDGARSLAQTVQTPGIVPDPPSFSVQLIEETSAMVSWVVENRSGGPQSNILGFRLTYGLKNDTPSFTTSLKSRVRQYNVTDLVPGSTYSFLLSARGRSGYSPEVLQELTVPEFPPAGFPLLSESANATCCSLQFSWQPPDVNRRPVVSGYMVSYAETGSLQDPRQIMLMSLDTSYTIHGLNPNQEYDVSIRAHNRVGPGPFSPPVRYQTSAFETDVPRNFSVNLATRTSVLLTWEFPETSSPYRFTYNRQKMEVDAHLRKAVIPNLAPDTSYDFKITSPEGNMGGLRHRIHAKTSPPIVIARPEIDHTRDTETTITIILPSLDTKTTLFSQLLKDISQKQRDPRQRQVDLRRAYITARFTPSSLPAFFALGDQLDYGGFDNRALEPGQEYVFFILAELNSTTGMFVASPYSDPVIAPDSDPQPLDAGDGLIWVVGPVLAVVFIICIVIAILLYKNKRKDSEPGTKCLLNNAEMMAHHPTDPVEMRRINFQTPGMMSHPPIPISELAEHTELLKANDNLRLSQDDTYPYQTQPSLISHAYEMVRKTKHRHAYSYSRIVLPGIMGSDYINANYIDGYRKQNAYIATQGPLPETFGDFWRMVWEQRAASVVMMTKLEEKSRIKCDQYWPSRGTDTYGLVQVTLLDTMELATFCVRTFSLHKLYYIIAQILRVLLLNYIYYYYRCNYKKVILIKTIKKSVCLYSAMRFECVLISVTPWSFFRQQKAYIATQGPLAETTEDFWRMLWEHNSTIVVMLTKLREMGREKCHQYWPAERSARYQYFVVDPMAEYNMPQYILREFKVTDARDGQSRTVRQFQFTDWPEQGVPKSGEGFIDFIGQVHKTKEQFGQDGPISVHCSAGVGRTGVFITLSIVLERMRYEGAVDIFQTVKMLRTQRPAMVQTEDEYQFCYQAALEYLGSFDHYAT